MKEFKEFCFKHEILTSQEWKKFREYVLDFFEPNYSIAKEELNFVVSLKKPLPVNIFSLLSERIKKNIFVAVKFSWKISRNVILENDVIEYLHYFVKSELGNDKKLSLFFKNHVRLKLTDNNLTFFYKSNAEKDILIFYENKFKGFLEEIGFGSYTFSYLPSFSLIKLADVEVIKNEMNDVDEEKKYFNYWNELNKVSAKTTISLSDVSINTQKFIIEGKIFKIMYVETKKNIIFNFYVTDYTSSLVFTAYVNEDNNLPKDFLKNFKENDWVKVKAIPKFNKYKNNELYGEIILIQKINTPDKYMRTDDAESRRIELITHTKMSSYDGLISPKDIVAYAKKYGWKTISITDTNNVQSFPEIMQLAEKENLKVIYGVNIDTAPINLPLVDRPNDKKWSQEIYVVFDLETTGLYPANDEIIEFAGIKYKGVDEIERLNFLITPTKQISPEITELTGITNELLKNEGISIKNALKKISKFCENATLVAHNGILFDLPFLNWHLNFRKMPVLKNPIIDTLRISWALNPNYTLHNLAAISRRYKVEYDEEAAHRAMADTIFLSKIWTTLLSNFERDGIQNEVELNDKYHTKSFLLSSRPYKTLIYAKNQKGLHQIYDILSKTLTVNLQKLDLDLVSNNRDNILITNDPVDGDIINDAFVLLDNELIEKIKFYDFITISPPSTFNHKIHNKLMTEKDYCKAINRIITITKSLNKLCVASGNVYYLEPYEIDYHMLLVQTKAIGGKRHRFFDYHKEKQHIPSLYLRTTQELKNEFSFLKNQNLIDEIVVENSNHIANQCNANITPVCTKLCSPKIENSADDLKLLTMKNAKLMYGDNLHPLVSDRINRELKAIIDNGYSVVYWIAYLLVKKSKQDGYLVGSRGSVGSSLVATLIGVSEVNPLPAHYLCKKCKFIEFNENVDDGFDLKNKLCPNCNLLMNIDGHNIPFETFMGFEGDKVPDIDLNFSGLYQPIAHNYIRELFGKEHTLRAGTITTIAEKTAFGFAKSYFEKLGLINEVNSAEIQRYAQSIIGVKRTTGQHPGGIMVFPKNKKITDFTPYNFPADDTSLSWWTTHFAFEYLHDSLLKLDILGHDDPTILRMLQEITGIDPITISNSDPKVLSLFTNLSALNIIDNNFFKEQTGVIGIPEFGTNFVRQILEKTKPSSFADLIRISGLSHGTDVWKNNAETLISKSLLKLSDIIACRDDIMTYLIKCKIEQKQSFLIMEDVRKGKKLKPEYEKIMKKANIPDWYINSCNKIKYIFPKAHATAYVLMAWRIAWFKIYYPLAYYAAHFTYKIIEQDIQTIIKGPEKIYVELNKLKERLNSKNSNSLKAKEINLIDTYESALELYARGFKIVNVSLEKSLATKYLVDEKNKCIIPPFVAIGGLGEVIANSIVEARNEKPFVSIEDLKLRTKINSTQLVIFKENNITNNLKDNFSKTLFDL